MSKAVWALGFRPFFLAASVYALLNIGVWTLHFSGILPLIKWSNPIWWHSHEMIFGFTVAVIAGFLLTASQNWSGIPGVKGSKLLILVLLWAMARLFSFLLSPQNLLLIVSDLAFLPLLTYFLTPYLWGKDKAKNKKFVYLLALLFSANLFFYLGINNIKPFTVSMANRLALDIILAVILIISGRILPFFTQRTLGIPQKPNLVIVERGIVLFMSVYALLGIFSELKIRAAVAVLLALLVTARLMQLSCIKCFKVPLLGVLYSGMFWIVISFTLEASELFFLLNPSLKTHAFTAGAITVLCYGMMARVSLGHTGRNLKPAKFIEWGFLLINMVALIRVFGPLIDINRYLFYIKASTSLWMISFLLLSVFLWPLLTRPRVDGLQG